MMTAIIERLQRLSIPAICLWLFALVYGILAGATESGELPKRANLAASICLPFLVAFWALTDARQRQRKTYYDFDSFVFFAWPFLLPVYLYQTRGIRAIWTAL